MPIVVVCFSLCSYEVGVGEERWDLVGVGTSKKERNRICQVSTFDGLIKIIYFRSGFIENMKRALGVVSLLALAHLITPARV